MSESLPSPLRTAVLAVLLSSLALGWCIVELNMMTGDRALRGALQLDTFEITACTAVLYVGAGFSALLCHFPSEHFGRRATLLACDVLFVAGSLLCVASDTVTLIFVGRTVIGIGAGAALTVVPALLAEIAPAQQRGVVGFAHTCAITLGSWLCAVGGSCLVTYVDGGWRIIFLGLCVFGTLQLLLAPLVPESPRWLARHRGVAAALHMLGAIRPKGTPEAKLLLEIPPDDGGQSAAVSWDELRALGRPISIGSTLLVMQARDSSSAAARARGVAGCRESARARHASSMRARLDLAVCLPEGAHRRRRDEERWEEQRLNDERRQRGSGMPAARGARAESEMDARERRLGERRRGQRARWTRENGDGARGDARERARSQPRPAPALLRPARVLTTLRPRRGARRRRSLGSTWSRHTRLPSSRRRACGRASSRLPSSSACASPRLRPRRARSTASAAARCSSRHAR